MLNNFKKFVTVPLLTFFGRRRAERIFRDPPVLIGGCGRSGTSLLLSILAAHPQVLAIPTETGVFSNWETDPAAAGASPAWRPQRMDRIYRHILSRSIPDTVTRYCEKTPSNVRHIEQILNFFQGRVKFIHLIRDGRDVMTSVHPENPDTYWVDPERWVSDVRTGLAHRALPQLLTIKYEDLILQHQQTMQQVCDFLEIEYTPALKSWFEHSDVRKNRAWFHPLKQLHPSSIGKWKQEKFRSRVAEIMRDGEVVKLLRELNYPVN